MSSYGTSIEESEGKSELARARHVQKNSGISIWKDQVLDDNGKRRLHGAFKGFCFVLFCCFVVLFFCFFVFCFCFVEINKTKVLFFGFS